MAERFPRRPAPAARRASESAVDMGGPAQEQVPEVYARDMARPHSLERLGHHRLAPRHTQVVRGTKETISATEYPPDRAQDAPAVRIDMDLDLDIALQAKIKGRIELSILYVTA